METLNSKILLCKNIKMDREYKNVLRAGDEELLTICNNPNNLIASSNSYSFIKEEQELLVDFTYEQCLQANYIAFQNPSYSNKWFFAFIDNVEYNSNKATRIKFTIDVWSTWYGYWTRKTCFVVREHVNSDIIGEHTIPENLDTGDYIVNNVNKLNSLNESVIVLASTIDPYIQYNESTGKYDLVGGYNGGGVYNGVRNGFKFYAFENTTTSQLVNVLEAFADAGKNDAIGMIFIAPKKMITTEEGTFDNAMIVESINPFAYTWGEDSTSESEITRPTSLNGYIPKNNKCFTYPYTFLNMTNNNGGNAIYKYELFTPIQGFENICQFDLLGALTPSMDIIALPYNYNGVNGNNYNEGLSGAKLPICGWSSDVYTNWLTQNAVNIAINFESSIIQTAGSLFNASYGDLGGAVSNAFSGISGAVSQGNEIYKHSLVPRQAEGNVNTGNVSFSSGYSTFVAYQMSVKYEYAKIIDDYFTRYGYLVNTLKQPNFTGRQYYNYVQIGASEDIVNGQIPNKYVDVINRICRNGVTIWHNHNNMGDFSVNNPIV